MKPLLFGVVLVATLLSSHSLAQRGAMGGGAIGGGAVRGGGIGMPGFGGRPGGMRGGGIFGRSSFGLRRDRSDFVNSGYGSWGFTDGYGDFGSWDNSPEAPPSPPVMLVVPQITYTYPPPPPEPPHPVTHDYNWPASTGATANALSLVWKDGTVRLARAVWVQDETVNYIAQDGSVARASITAIDRDATRRTNAQGGLSIWLP